jgi:hypothetical protein
VGWGDFETANSCYEQDYIEEIRESMLLWTVESMVAGCFACLTGAAEHSLRSVPSGLQARWTCLAQVLNVRKTA